MSGVRPIGTAVPRAGRSHPANRGRDPTTGSNAKEGSTALKPFVSRQAFNTPAWQTSLISVKQGVAAPGPGATSSTPVPGADVQALIGISWRRQVIPAGACHGNPQPRAGTFEMTAHEVGGRTELSVTRTVSPTSGRLTADVRGQDVSCRGTKAPWLTPPPS